MRSFDRLTAIGSSPFIQALFFFSRNLYLGIIVLIIMNSFDHGTNSEFVPYANRVSVGNSCCIFDFRPVNLIVKFGDLGN